MKWKRKDTTPVAVCQLRSGQTHPFGALQSFQRQGRSYITPEEASTSAHFMNTVPETTTDGLPDPSQATDTTAMHAGNNYH